MLEDCFEEEEEQQRQAASLSRSNRNKQWPAKSIQPSVFFSRPEKGHSAPDVTWACAWCLVPWNITPK